MIQKSYIAKPSEVKKYYLIDAKDKVLGRVAAKAATIIRGKHKATYTPNVDCGDFVVIINAEKVRVTGKKETDKIYEKYTGYHSGLKVISFKDLLQKSPTTVLKVAVNGMIPSGPMGNRAKTKLRIFKGEKHNHEAQKPIPITI